MLFAGLPSLPNMHALFVLLLTLGALYLFKRDDIALETSSLAVIAVLTVFFALFPFQYQGETLDPVYFFHGFGHEALVTVCALMIIGQAIVLTGALEPIGRNLSRMWKVSPSFSLLSTLIIAGALSAFVNNTPIVVLLLPILISVAIRTQSNVSGMLMPMGFATLVGGMFTTIGTSTNLLVVSVAADLGMERFGMFDFAPIAFGAAVVALLYLWLIAPRILPEREASLPDTSPRLFSAYLHVGENCPLIGEKVSKAIKLTDGMIRIESIQRGKDFHKLLPLPDTIIKVNDRIHVKDYPDRLKEYESVLKATLHSGKHKIDAEHPLEAGNQVLAEVVIILGSGLIGKTLKSANFSSEYGISAVALHREGKPMDIERQSIGSIPLRVGDILLVQGDADQIEELKSQQGILVVDGAAKVVQTKKAPVALGVLFGVVLLPVFDVLPIVISAMCGVFVLLASRCLNWQEVASALSTQVILIVAASLALGAAMVSTGAAQYLAEIFVALSSSLPVGGVLAALMLLLAILTNIVSNNAAAVIGTPIAMSVAQQLGAPPEPFVLAVLFGANLSYATPMAYKTNLLVMNAGGYQFSDFVKVGVPLIALMWITLSITLNIVYF
ncbi:sodium:sulfate symporter [Thalassotalea loyana]|uniref:Sodium:sulfate symporter n=1 Tax=Thalassotalea loyana TaxID=280483 RepID=A0ABQ6HDR4_9GAMM|nr:SLC13 family permease [Thalassotalea loyana]GLX85579.1 sodium:sulfate symporter [Thalassotalea loyana]